MDLNTDYSCQMRLQCTAGAIILEFRDNQQCLQPPFLTAGMLFSQGCKTHDFRACLSNPPGLLVLETKENSFPQYLARVGAYVNHFGANFVMESGVMAGPGLATILTVSDISTLGRFHENNQKALMDLASDVRAQAALANALCQPILLEFQPFNIQSISTYLESLFLQLYEDNKIHGIVFQNSENLNDFRTAWLSKTTLPLPFTIFKSDAEGLFQFFGSRYQCDACICTSTIGSADSRKLASLRLANIPQLSFGNGDEKPNLAADAITIGVLAIQGAYKIEKWLIDAVCANSKELNKSVVTSFFQSPRELEEFDFDVIVIPGGWHGPLLNLIDKVNLTLPLKAYLTKRNKTVIASCAGAILVRSPTKESRGCSAHMPLGLLDVAINNNALNGRVPYKLRSEEVQTPDMTVMGTFIGAPEFLELGDTVETLAKTECGKIIAVKDRFPSSGSEIFAFSSHDKSLYSLAIKSVQRRMLEKSE